MTLLNAADAVYAGNVEATKVYAGTVEVWPPAGGGGITLVGVSQTANVLTTLSLAVPSHDNGDRLIVVAVKTNGGATPPATPTGITLTTLSSGNATRGGWYVGTAVLTGSSVTLGQTSGGVDHLYAIVVRGASSIVAAAGANTLTPSTYPTLSSTPARMFQACAASTYPASSSMNHTPSGWADTAATAVAGWGSAKVVDKEGTSFDAVTFSPTASVYLSDTPSVTFAALP